MEKKYSDEAVFCVKYLHDRGYLSEDKLDELTSLIDDFKVDFKLIKVNKDYYTELATKLRELWPSGNKDGKYSWRDSVDNLRIRLKSLWELRGLKEYSIEDVLMVARQYLAQFEDNTKYMKVLKYFIYKQKPATVQADGQIKYSYESDLADRLEALTEEQRQQNEMEAMFNSMPFQEGNLI